MEEYLIELSDTMTYSILHEHFTLIQLHCNRGGNTNDTLITTSLKQCDVEVLPKHGGSRKTQHVIKITIQNSLGDLGGIHILHSLICRS